MVLLGTHIFLLGSSLAFHAWVRPGLWAMHQQEKLVHPAAVLALSGWLLPAGIGAGVLFGIVAFLHRKRSDRLRWLAIATAVNAVFFMGAASGGYLPLLM